jgi:hypothetical protein
MDPFYSGKRSGRGLNFYLWAGIKSLFNEQNTYDYEKINGNLNGIAFCRRSSGSGGNPSC